MNSQRFAVRRIVLVAGLVLCCGPALAQDPALSSNPRTGDVWVDIRLNDINQYGGGYRDSFINEMVRYHNAPRSLITELLGRPNWTPGDIYYACALAAQTGRPCRSVADDYDRDRGQGWGVLAQRMGIAPGSAQFHALKRGFVPTYDRWGRPVRIDPDLARDFPNRPVAVRHEAPHAHPPQAGDRKLEVKEPPRDHRRTKIQSHGKGLGRATEKLGD